MTPKWNPRTKGNRFSRTIVFHTSNSKERELFLELAMKAIGNANVRVETRLDRIELEIFGNRDFVDNLITKLRNIETNVYNATNPTNYGNFRFQIDLINRIFSPPIGLLLWKEAIEIFGFEVELEYRDTLVTPANITDLEIIHQKVTELRTQISPDHNKDIQRFLTLVSLESNHEDIDNIIGIALSQNILDEKDGILHFNMDHNKARDKLLLHLERIEVSISEDKLDDLNIEDLAFSGGKMVFMKDGKEIDQPELNHSSYDGENIE